MAGTGAGVATDLTKPSSFSWRQLNANGAPEGEDLAPLAEKLTRSLVFSADVPRGYVEAQLRAVAAQLVDEARRDGQVESMRFRLHLRCVTEKRVIERDETSMPWLWTSVDTGGQETHKTVRSCAVKLLRAVKLREEATHTPMRPYTVQFPPAVGPER